MGISVNIHALAMCVDMKVLVQTVADNISFLLGRQRGRQKRICRLSSTGMGNTLDCIWLIAWLLVRFTMELSRYNWTFPCGLRGRSHLHQTRSRPRRIYSGITVLHSNFDSRASRNGNLGSNDTLEELEQIYLLLCCLAWRTQNHIEIL